MPAKIPPATVVSIVTQRSQRCPNDDRRGPDTENSGGAPMVSMNHTATCKRSFRRTGLWSATVLVRDDIRYGQLSIGGGNVAGCGLPMAYGRSEKSHTPGRWKGKAARSRGEGEVIW